MNNALTAILIVAVLALSAVFAVKTRYQVIQTQDSGTLIIDRWEFETLRIVERSKNGKWIAKDVIKGGQSVIDFEVEGVGSDKQKKAEEKIAI